MKVKRFVLLCLATALVLLPVVANTASGSTINFGDLIAAVSSGSCGEDLTWSYKDGTLTISGTGAMKDYSASAGVPWYHKRASVQTLVIDAGVTSIGNYAFDCCAALTEVHYGGTQTQWNTVSIGSNNAPLLAASLHFAQAHAKDLDGDGALSTDDAVYLLLYVMFGPTDYPITNSVSLDMNSSGSVDTDDAVYLLLHVMFGPTDYPLPA